MATTYDAAVAVWVKPGRGLLNYDQASTIFKGVVRRGKRSASSIGASFSMVLELGSFRRVFFNSSS